MSNKILGFETPLNHFSKVYPYTKIFSTIPLKIFGCTTFVHIHKEHRTMLDPHALKCVFVWYSLTQKGHKWYDPICRKIFVSMDVTFFENQPYFTKNTLQGESVVEKDQFWEASLPLPTFDDNVSPSLSHSSGLGLIGSENSRSNSTTQLSFIVPNNEELLIRGELL